VLFSDSPPFKNPNNILTSCAHYLEHPLRAPRNDRVEISKNYIGMAKVAALAQNLHFFTYCGKKYLFGLFGGFWEALNQNTQIPSFHCTGQILRHFIAHAKCYP